MGESRKLDILLAWFIRWQTMKRPLPSQKWLNKCKNLQPRLFSDLQTLQWPPEPACTQTCFAHHTHIQTHRKFLKFCQNLACVKMKKKNMPKNFDFYWKVQHPQDCTFRILPQWWQPERLFKSSAVWIYLLIVCCTLGSELACFISCLEILLIVNIFFKNKLYSHLDGSRIKYCSNNYLQLFG